MSISVVTYKDKTLTYEFLYEVADFVAEVDGLDHIEDEALIMDRAMRLDAKSKLAMPEIADTDYFDQSAVTADQTPTPADPPMQRYSHDIPMSERDGLHAKSIDCPCGTDVEQVTPNSSIVYHQRRTTRVERILADVERVAAHKRDSGRSL